MNVCVFCCMLPGCVGYRTGSDQEDVTKIWADYPYGRKHCCCGVIETGIPEWSALRRKLVRVPEDDIHGCDRFTPARLSVTPARRWVNLSLSGNIINTWLSVTNRHQPANRELYGFLPFNYRLKYMPKFSLVAIPLVKSRQSVGSTD